MLSQIRRDIVDHNLDEKIAILSFEMEMLGVDQVTRDISSKIEMSTKQLYSADSEEDPLSPKELAKVDKIADSMKYYPISIIDEIGTVNQIRDSILEFVETNQLIENSIGLVVTFDHSLLVDAADGDSEKDVVDSLYRTLVKLKKHFESIGLRSIFIVLSQLNRNIESTERVINPNLQYPNKTDLFASSAAFYCSDVVIITHKPILVEGIREYYGPTRGLEYPCGLPTRDPDSGKPMIYWHIIKSRFSTNRILMMVDDFVNSRILEYHPKPITQTSS